MNLIDLSTLPLLGKLSSLINKALDEFTEEIKQIINNNILEYQAEEYKRNSQSKTIIHRTSPKNLSEFYQPLFLRQANAWRFSFSFDFDEPQFIPTDSISTLLNKNLKQSFITILGSAGSGKSTLIKYLFTDCIKTNFKIPIKIELRYLNDYDDSLIEYIKDKIFKINKLGENDRIIERLMSSGDFIFFLDGYDEIRSSKKSEIAKNIEELTKLFNKNYYILTSRPYSDIELLPMFHNYTVCELSNDEIIQFIQKQIPTTESEVATKMIDAIAFSENTGYRSFLSNPLLLSMFILTFQTHANIPQKMSEFYSQVFDTLYSIHDSISKLAFERERQSGLIKEQFIEILKLFSFLSFFKEKFFFPSIYIQQELNYVKQKKRIVFDNDKLISDLQVAICILNKEGTEYTFPHRSLQEYFAALYIASLEENNKCQIYQKILTYCLEDSFARRASSRTNFHNILSELDTKIVTRYIIIPFLNDFKNKIESLVAYTYIQLIHLFSNIQVFYDNFDFILNRPEINKASNKNSKWQTVALLQEIYVSSNVTSLTKQQKQQVQLSIIPFLTKYYDEVGRIITFLENQLKEDNKADQEIIALIP